MVTTGGNSGLAGTSDPSGTLHAFVTLLVYMAVLGGAASWLFLRKDVAGARGE